MKISVNSLYMPAGSQRFQVGAISCTLFTDGYASYPLDWFFPDADRARLASGLARRGLPQDRILSPYTCMLVETGRRVILIDTGGGTGTATSGAVIARLEMAGIRPHVVDTVILTHAHADHIGGTIDARGNPAFPNAEHLVAEAEYDFWMTRRTDLNTLRLPAEAKLEMLAVARRRLGALHFQMETVDREREIAPGVLVIPAPGHTPGHMAILIASEGQKLLNLGDAAVHPLHLEEPGWQNGFDLAPDGATATRRALLERATSENMHVMAFHFPFPSLGRVTSLSEGGWAWSPGW